jgi:hypothetical protein
MRRKLVLAAAAVSVVLFAVADSPPARADERKPKLSPEPGKDPSKSLRMPESLRARHEDFHAEFVKATKETGKVGDAARAMEKVATAHFPKAKDAFAPLSLLPRLVDGKLTAEEMAEALKLADKLRTGLPKSHGEHRELVAGLKKLAEAAKEEGKTDYVRFAERLTLHIQEEEEVLYPTVLLIGAHVKASVGKK